jgi:magnesium transporter
VSSLADTLVVAFAAHHPAAAAAALREIPPDEVSAVVFALPAHASAAVLGRMDPDDAVRALSGAPDDSGGQALLALDRAHCAALYAQLDEQQRRRWASVLPRAVVDEVKEILAYPPGTAGSLMDRVILRCRSGDTAEQVLTKLRQFAGRRVADVVVVDEAGRLEGLIPLQVVAAAAPEASLRSLGVRQPVRVLPMTPRDDLLELAETHRLASVPVVDHEDRLLGVIRQDALLNAAHDEGAADVQAMVGASKEERALSTPWTAIRSRLPWLQINLATAFLASAVVGMFDSTIAQVTALAVLLPVVAGQSGNTGAQALAVTSRGLALREIRISHWWRVVRKEAIVGLGSGVAVAIVTALGVFVWSRSTALACVIGVSMVMSMVLAAVAGAAVPLTLTMLGRDPATASSIILTTVTDIVGFFSFLGLATLMLGSLGG